MNPRYLFIMGESEFHFLIQAEPTPADFESARSGILSIYRLSDSHVYSRNGAWTLAPAGVLVDDIGGLMNVHPDYIN
jgi:hypothetical protein